MFRVNSTCGIPDLLIAATAERAGLTVLHVDQDFDLIADPARDDLCLKSAASGSTALVTMVAFPAVLK
jgi:hypothetical protein